MSGEQSGPHSGPGNAPPPGPRHPILRNRLKGDQGSTWWTTRRKAIGAASVALLFVISLVAGVAYFWSQRSEGASDYVEVYVTDLPANFTKLDVRISGVYVGDPNYTLELVSSRFDLLSLRGPTDALLIAKGEVPAGDHQAIRIVFRSVRALLNGQYVDLQMPGSMLTIRHGFGLGSGSGNAFLFDINVEKSVHVTEKGLTFAPHVDAIYVHSYGSTVAQGSQGPGFTKKDPDFATSGSSESPSNQSVEQPSTKMEAKAFVMQPTASSNSKFKWNAEAAPPPTTATPTPTVSSQGGEISPAPTSTESYLPSPGEVNSVPNDPTQIAGWFVQFADENTNTTRMIALVEEFRGEVLFVFGSVAAAFAAMTAEQAAELAEHPAIQYVESDEPIVANLASSRAAIRLPQVHDPLLGFKDPLGRALDGQGVGMGVIDIGFDGTHPDLPHRLLHGTNPLLAANFKVESLFLVDAPNTDTTSGHGTHVLGILAGRGELDPTQRGVSPGVKAYGFAIGEASTTLWPNTALDWLVQNHDKVLPPIKVVSNSWGSGAKHDPNSLTTRLIEQLVDEGVVVVFSAGNSGGDGRFPATTSQCQIPKAGVICVAAFDDLNTGSRDGRVAPYSSRGWTTSPSTWPDISAPGTSIRSARPVLGSVTGVGLLNAYTVMDGTSMAAPHVSGVVALMLQARPGLSPAQVESILEASAYKFADGGDYGADGHVAKGHGLLDAYAAIQLAKAS